MNILLRGRHFVVGSHLITNQNKIKLIQNNLNSVLSRFDGIQIGYNKRCHSHSMNFILMSQIAPLAGIVLGRIIQKRWPRLRYVDRKAIMDSIYENKLKVISVLGLIGGALTAVIHRFSEETPLTKRQRFVIFNKGDYEPISDMLFKIIYKSHKNRILAVDHRTTQRIHKIVRKLLESNKNFEEIAHKNWSVYVIKAPNTANAFVLPTGQIFVYTGIIGVCDNDDQLAAILAHELSHTLLVHGKEVLSQEVCVDLFHSFAVMLLWIRLNPISALIGTIFSGFALKSLFILPKRRLIELEADFVGLALTAKACYDVREGSAFWMKMSAIEDNKWFNSLSTHPSNDFRYELMDTYMESMIQIMECFDCPKLSEADPRQTMRRKILYSERTVFRKD